MDSKIVFEVCCIFSMRIVLIKAWGWSPIRFLFVTFLELYKFSQNPEMGEFLRSTKGIILVEANPYDNIWGIGIREYEAKRMSPDEWPGRNLLGKCLMKVREMI